MADNTRRRVVAKENLYVGAWALAHPVGDEFEADSDLLDRNGWTDKVATAGTKAADAAQEQAEELKVAAVPADDTPPPAKTTRSR